MLQPPAAIAVLSIAARLLGDCGSGSASMADAIVRHVADLDPSCAHATRPGGWTSVFVKLASGPPAFGPRTSRRRRSGEHAITTVEDTARYNTRRLQWLTTRARIDRVLGFLLGEGAIVERTIPKARHDGRYRDLRGATSSTASRRSSAYRPRRIRSRTLHLGGTRGDLAAFRARVPLTTPGSAGWPTASPGGQVGGFHVGVDLMFEPRLDRHRILEGNAFGDLLPNLERDGVDVYGWQIRRLALSSAGE